MDSKSQKSINVLNKIIKDFDLQNAKRLSESLGFERPERIYKVLRGNNSISGNLAKTIHEKYPKYNLNWILTGEGEILDNNQIIKSNTGSIEIKRIIDVLLENRERFEKDVRFMEYIEGHKKDAIIEYQEKLLRKIQ